MDTSTGAQPTDVAAELAALDGMIAETEAVLENVSAEDPFWSFQASTGAVSAEGMELLEKWVKPDDRPTKFYGMKDVFACTSEVVVLSGGNQAGKTIHEAVDSHIQVTGEVPESLKDVYPAEKLPTKWPVYGRQYGKTSDFINEVLVPKYKHWMPKKYWHKEGWERTYNKVEKTLRYYLNGSKFIGAVKFLTYDQDVSTTQGVGLKFAKFDEVPPKAHWDEAKMRFIAQKRIDMEIAATATEGIGWIENVLLPRANLPGENVSAFEISTLTNTYANLKNLDEVLKDLSYEEVLVRLLGQHKSLSGLIYKGPHRLRPEVHLIEPFDLNYHEYVVYRGLDPHPSKETCCVEMAVDRFGTMFIVGTYYDDSDSVEVKKALARRAVERNYRLAWTAYDPSLDYEAKGYDSINIVQKYKESPNAVPAMLAAQKYKGSIDAGIDQIKLALKLGERSQKPQLYFFKTPEVMRLVKDIQTLERDASRNEDKRGKRDKINEGNRDHHAAMRYIFQHRPIWIEPENDVAEPYSEERYL